jgi:uncharacterized protein (DUF4415 family)
MAKGKRTGRRYERHSAKALKTLASESDLARLAAVSERELERSIASDPDWAKVPADWYKGAELVMPRRKQLITLRLDPDVVEWFRRQGAGYQTKINAVLRAFVGAQRQRRTMR